MHAPSCLTLHRRSARLSMQWTVLCLSSSSRSSTQHGKSSIHSKRLHPSRCMIRTKLIPPTKHPTPAAEFEWPDPGSMCRVRARCPVTVHETSEDKTVQRARRVRVRMHVTAWRRVRVPKQFVIACPVELGGTRVPHMPIWLRPTRAIVRIALACANDDMLADQIILMISYMYMYCTVLYCRVCSVLAKQYR